MKSYSPLTVSCDDIIKSILIYFSNPPFIYILYGYFLLFRGFFKILLKMLLRLESA